MRLQLLRALRAGRGLRLEIGDVLLGIARGPRAAAENRAHRHFVERAAMHHADAVEQDALFRHVLRERRHRARRDAADIGMMPAAGDKERTLAVDEYRHHHRDVRQMRAAVIWRVGDEDVAVAHRGMLAHDRR